MANSLPDSFRSYRTGARAVQAKSLGSLALGAAAFAALPHEAVAQIIVSSGSVLTANSVDRLHFNPQTGSITQDSSGNLARIAVLPTASADGFYSLVQPSYGYVSGAVVNGSDLQKFALGESISGANFVNYAYLNSTSGGVTTGWSNTTGYFGFKATISSNVHYGWVKITTNIDASIVTIDAMGFNTVIGQSITAGQTTAVPEPATSAALLALGAAGLVAYRQRKKIQRAA